MEAVLCLVRPVPSPDGAEATYPRADEAEDFVAIAGDLMVPEPAAAMPVVDGFAPRPVACGLVPGWALPDSGGEESPGVQAAVLAESLSPGKFSHHTAGIAPDQPEGVLAVESPAGQDDIAPPCPEIEHPGGVESGKGGAPVPDGMALGPGLSRDEMPWTVRDGLEGGRVLLGGDPPAASPWAPEAGVEPPRRDPAGALARPDLPRAVVQQIAAALAAGAEHSAELVLSSEELGLVRLTLATSETGAVVSVLAEQGDTLELMRRNIGLLARDLQQIGFSDLHFGFGRRPRPAPLPEPVPTVAGPALPEIRPPRIYLSPPPREGLDLRI